MVVIILLIYAIITGVFISPLRNINRNVQKDHSDLLTIINEVLSGIGTIKLQQGEERFTHIFHHTNQELSKGLFKILNLKSIFNSIIVIVESIGTLIIIWIGSKLVISNVISLGELVAFESLTAFFIIPVKNIIKSFGEFQNALISVGRVIDILEIEKEYSDIISNKSFISQINTVKLKNIDYQYNLVNKSLDNVDIILKTGSIIGIMGVNGSGKTTLLKMIGTLINPNQGEIIFEDTKLSEELLPSLRTKLAYVSQEPFVFEGTLRENLTLGYSKISDEEIDIICNKFGLFDFTAEGNGLGLFLLENGDNLSGGQKQKVGLARALLSNPEILLLDEATSSLDKESEKEVFEYLNSIKKDKIIVSIFHEEDFMKFVDRLIVMEKGKIIYDGLPFDK
ncbi:ATP-binding cassette domain-containing protein [Streptococcus pluranimalium]|uniref:ATP-binding cassette domain-containing protein n=1 Tax=Streptococcus pluranimalium TaxID=82348 RepID=UPI003F68DAFA